MAYLLYISYENNDKNIKRGAETMKHSIFKIFVTGIFFSVLINCVTAQTFLFQGIPREKTQFSLRFMRPNFKYGSDLSTLSGIYDLSVNIPINQKLNFVGSIPYQTFTFEDYDTENGVGNIYIGLQTKSGIKNNKKSIGSFGVFLPTAEDNFAVFYSSFTNFIDYHKYFSDLLTVYGNFAYFSNSSKGVYYGIELGPNIMIPTTKDYYGDTELFMHYGISVGFQDNNFTVLAELMGLASITTDEEKFEDRFIHVLDFGFTYTINRVTPGIFYKAYLKEDMSDVVEGVLGIKIDVSVG